MINKYINKDYINNSSDIKAFINDEEFKEIIKKLDNKKYIKVTSKLIHKKSKINQIEQFIFNLDNYISYIKQLIHINPIELRYILKLTLNNKHNKILYSDLYYYDYIELYQIKFESMFMYNYINNIKLLKKYIKINKRKFNELILIINTHKKRTYCYFENINNNNMNFYLPIIESIENTN